VIVHTFEAMAMVPQATPTRGHLSLDDHHQTAWRLFSQGAADLQDGDSRPFLFRVQPHPSLPMDVYLLRAPMAFAGAREYRVDLSEGEELTLSWLHLPSRSRLLASPQDGRAAGKPRGQRFQPGIEEWPQNCRDKIRRHGWEVRGEIEVHRHGVFRLPGKGGRLIGVAHCQARLRVTDPRLAAEAWLKGVSRKRGYGLGLLLPLHQGGEA
jgi:hypothetical protein